MGLANIMGHGYSDGYAQGHSDGSSGGGSPTTRPIRMVVGHHHTGTREEGGGCYSVQVKEACGASITWTSSGVDSIPGYENQYYYWARGTCANGHSCSAGKFSPTGVDPGEIKYTTCRETVIHYETPSGHPAEGSFIRNVDINPGETPGELLNLTETEMVTAVQNI